MNSNFSFFNWFYEIPSCNSALKSQTEQKEISVENFIELFEEPHITTKQRIWQFLSFLIFLGPIRMILFIFFLFIIAVMIKILSALKSLFRSEERFRKISAKILIPIGRIALFCLGIVKISFKGSPDHNTRILIANHLALIDCFLVFLGCPCSFVAAAFLQKSSFVQAIHQIYDFVFIERKIHNHFTAQIQEIAANKHHPPLLIFPEGKVSDGSVLIGFRTGAFITEEAVQPVTVRYKHWLIPEGISTISWMLNNNYEYFYQLFSVPFYTAEVEFLPVMQWNSKEPEKRAIQAQLEIANHLGVPALNKTNSELKML